MTTTVRHGDALTECPDAITLEVRAKALFRYAELAILDDFPADALPVAVAAMASPAVTCPEGKFDDLIDAVRDRQAFDADPRGYANEHDWPTSETALDALDERIAGNIDCATWSLLHPHPACVRCQRSGRIRAQWNPANWPTTVYCEHHEAAVS